jgi:diaminohydroxyphosphoribosylaminopyrimidine deaminase / 5-amino-6-(5-phosphoribosylamino)uracil reductase
VGAVLVKGGHIVGEGFTQPPGGPHAEVVALRQAGDSARGATLYVTLEPCAHHGRTPPCADALIEAGIAAVHVAVGDPNPRVDGAGLAKLRAAGIPVTILDGPPQAHRLVESFAKYITTGLPFVTAKFAMSLDGRIATRTGDSRWISNAESRRIAHRMRAESDAIMAGIGTALADDPLLTVRHIPLLGPTQPLRVIVDSTARLPVPAVMLTAPGKTLIAVADAAAEQRTPLEAAGAELVGLPGEGGRVDLSALLSLLGERKVTSVLVEGGAELLGALFDAQLIDKIVAFVAPVIIGGSASPGPIGGIGAERMADALHLSNVSYESVASDIIVTAYPPLMAPPPVRPEPVEG